VCGCGWVGGWVCLCRCLCEEGLTYIYEGLTYIYIYYICIYIYIYRGDSDEGSLHEKTMSVLAKAGYDVSTLSPPSFHHMSKVATTSTSTGLLQPRPA